VGTKVTVSKPYVQIARGKKLPSGISLEPPVPKGESAGKWIIGSGKKSSQQYLQSLYQQPQPVVIPKPKIKIRIPRSPKVSKSLISVRADTQELAPLMVGGRGKGISRYTGPTFESAEKETYVTLGGAIVTRTDIPQVRLDGTIASYKISTDVKVGTGIRLDTGVKQTQIQQIEQKQIQPLKVIQTAKTKQIQQIEQLIKTKQLTKTAQALKQVQIQKQVQKEKQLQKQIPQLKLLQRTTPPKLTPPKTPTFIPPIESTGLGKALKKVREIKPKQFEVFVRKFEKDISIGEFPTKRKAKKALVKTLKRTIRAGGFIELEGKKVKFGELGLGREFRPGKKEPWRIIQKKEKRLGEVEEVKELHFFKGTTKTKKGKGRKKNLFGI